MIISKLLSVGSFPKGANPRKYISGQVLSIMLSISIVFALAFVASIVCFIHQRKKLQSTAFSSEEGSSYSSGANLIKHKSISLHKPMIRFSVNPVAGCIGNVYLLFKGKTESLHATITHFAYCELENATNKFSESSLIGLGASSHVYHGHLRDGRVVAVKRLKIPEHYDADSVFLTEL
ncbi:hypothetical protein V2J09_008964 [Rumex salicifolius]